MFRLMPIIAICCSGCASLGPLNPMRPLENKLLYHPTSVTSVPAQPNVESVRIGVNDSQTIHGLFVAHAEPQGVLLYCHGNGGNIVDRLPRLRKLSHDHRLSVLGFDYRGYGASRGKPSETSIYKDARSARRWLAQKTGVAESEIILLGRSLGGGVAVELAVDGAKALILESTFTSTTDVGQSHVKWLPVSFLMSQKFESEKKISRYHGPLLQMHGSDDEVVPFELGLELHESANEPKRFVVMNGGHNNASHPDYEPLLAKFINSACTPEPQAKPHQISGSEVTQEFDCKPNSWQSR